MLLFWPQPAGSGLDFDAGEDGDGGANHVGGDRAAGPADQVSAAFSKSKADRSAVVVAQHASVIAEQPGTASATGEADVLLDGLLRWQGLAAALVVAA